MSVLEMKFLSSGHDYDSNDMTYLKTAVSNAVRIYMKDSGCSEICFQVSKNWTPKTQVQNSETGKETERHKKYEAVSPDDRYTFDRLVLPEKTKEQILAPLYVFQQHDLIFNQWGLKKIAFPMVALSFEGPPGTGKTMAAHAVAHYLGKKIIDASYSRIESSYVGEGSKNAEAIFEAAMKQDAVLFIDDAEALLSKRLNNVQSSADNGMNSMREQFLISLEKYKGLVIFATNKPESYDPALETRLWTIHFDLPNEEQRAEIWRNHLPAEFPTTATVNELARIDGVCGREIRSAVLEVATQLLYRANGIKENIAPATTEDFVQKIQDIITRRKTTVKEAKPVELSDKTRAFLAEYGPKAAKLEKEDASSKENKTGE